MTHDRAASLASWWATLPGRDRNAGFVVNFVRSALRRAGSPLRAVERTGTSPGAARGRPPTGERAMTHDRAASLAQWWATLPGRDRNGGFVVNFFHSTLRRLGSPLRAVERARPSPGAARGCQPASERAMTYDRAASLAQWWATPLGRDRNAGFVVNFVRSALRRPGSLPFDLALEELSGAPSRAQGRHRAPRADARPQVSA